MACRFLIESVKDNSLFRIECGQFEDISRPDKADSGSIVEIERSWRAWRDPSCLETCFSKYENLRADRNAEFFQDRGKISIIIFVLQFYFASFEASFEDATPGHPLRP